jgi:hypothetical protein
MLMLCQEALCFLGHGDAHMRYSKLLKSAARPKMHVSFLETLCILLARDHALNVNTLDTAD